MSAMPTPKQLLLEHRYDGNLAGDIQIMSSAGTSWREMAERVSARCGYEVSYESLRIWYGRKGTSQPTRRAS